MRFVTINNFVRIVAIFLVVGVLSGCASNQSTSVMPPPKFQKELDALRPDTVVSHRNAKSKYHSSIKYTVKKGDTVWRIAKNHGVQPDNLIKINRIRDVTDIKPGQQLLIPSTHSYSRTSQSKTYGRVAKASNESFIWPLRGKILTNFDKWVYGYKNNGIDIKVKSGQDVKASKSGIVALTSDTPDGWGKVVVLQHDDRSYTWYGYNSSILVSEGDTVTRGQRIAKAGMSGRAKQNKLHFKIFIHGVPKNPLKYLP